MHRRRYRHRRGRVYAPLLRVGALVCAVVWAAGCFGPPEESFDVYRQSLTVGGAVNAGCSTSQVDGLTKQLFAEVNCLRPNTLTDFGSLSGIKKNAGHVYTLMQPAAVNSLKKVLARRPGQTMNITSALRSLAQQYLLYKWYRAGRCGIGLAATPGNSNHQSGLALDVSPYSSWRSHFQAIGWRWLGSKDPVHFDYTGSGTVSLKSLSIKAFQRLWNKNHPNDKIAEDGVYGPQTEARLSKSPATGFAKAGCVCSEGARRPCGATDKGECKKGTQTCKNGGWGACTGQIKAKTEVCDGKDNDCDGKTDEGCDCVDGKKKACGSSDKGECKKGTQTCKAGKWGACTGEVKAKTEQCDGKDNDCDGKIDEDVKTGEACQTGQPGICSEGTTACEGGKQSCKPKQQAGVEKCNDNLDNNCDGQTDEGCGGCTEGEVRDCGSTIGECTPGKQLCEQGVWGACGRQVGPTDEICDGKDNDCDGKTDEDIADVGKPCDTGQPGRCQHGTQQCQGGRPVCAPPSGCAPPNETPFEAPPLPEPPAVLDGGADRPATGQDQGVIKVAPQGPCQSSLQCPTGQACISGHCVAGLRPQGCGCSQHRQPPAAPWLLLLLLLPLWRNKAR